MGLGDGAAPQQTSGQGNSGTSPGEAAFESLRQHGRYRGIRVGGSTGEFRAVRRQSGTNQFTGFGIRKSDAGADSENGAGISAAGESHYFGAGNQARRSARRAGKELGDAK